MSEYLAIKNWDKYQPPRSGHSDWIKDYTEKESDKEYRDLTVFQRYILDGCRRIRGRLGHNIPNDARYVANALSVSRSERGHVGSALRACTDLGLLILTDQQDSSSLHKIIKEEIREEESKSSAKAEPVIEKPKPVAKPKPIPSQIFDKAYEAYPRRLGRDDAEKAWGKAVNREAAKRVAPLTEHEDFLYQRVMCYGTVMRRKLEAEEVEKKFIPHMATWLNKGRYLDDPTEWEVGDKAKPVTSLQGRFDENERIWNELEETVRRNGSPPSKPANEPGHEKSVPRGLARGV